MPRLGRSQPFPPLIKRFDIPLQPSAGSVLKLSTIAWGSVKKVSTIAEASISKVSTIDAN